MAGWGVQNCPILRDVIYGRPPKCVWKYVKTFLWDYKSTKTTLFFTLTISGLMSFFFLVFLLPDVEAAEELLVLELDRDRISKLWQTPQTMQPKLEDWNKLENSRTLLSKIFIYFTTKDEYWGFSLGFIKSFVKILFGERYCWQTVSRNQNSAEDLAFERPYGNPALELILFCTPLQCWRLTLDVALDEEDWDFFRRRFVALVSSPSLKTFHRSLDI